MILSDEPYGDAAARSLGDRFLYVTDVALGRVLETPDEIADALATFEDFGGELDIQTAAVLGYDFLSDGSALIADELEASALGAGNVDRELAEGLTTGGDKWDRIAATDKLLEQGTQALVSLNAHFDHYRALPALGDKVPNFNDNLIATVVENSLDPDGLNVSLQQTLIFSMGCHSGLSVSDITIGRTNQDWAQTLGRQGSLYIGNTGFGYGDTETVAYTEQLMALFAAQVTSPLDLDPGTASASSTVGQALAWAKNQYISEIQSFSVYDEKALMESTFYGLPFYRIGGDVIDPAPVPAPPANSTAPDPVTDLETLTVVADDTVITNEEVPTEENGTYYRNVDADGNEQVIVAPGRPIQPKTVTDISVVGTDTTELAQVARGAVITAMTSTYVDAPDPVIATPVFDEGLNQPEPEPLPSVFPLQPLEIVTSTGAAGERQTLVQATGQYSGATGVQRLDDDIETVVYYAPPGDDDVIAPTITEVTSTVAGGTLRVSLRAGRADAPDLVKRVVVLVAQDPEVGSTIVLQSFDLVRRAGSNVWDGEFALDPTTTVVESRVQAVDQAGNVGYASNKTEGYPAAVATDPFVTGVLVPTAPADLADGVEATVEFTDPSGEFDAYDIVFDWGDGTTSAALATPPTSTSVGTATARRTYEAPGRYDVTATVTDGAGGVSSSVVEVVVVDPDAAPVIDDVVLDDVVAVDVEVDLTATFSDGSAPLDTGDYTVSVDWGDGTVVPAQFTEPEFPQDLGAIDAAHTYSGIGVYEVVLSVSDGTTTTTDTRSIIVNDPAAVPVIGALTGVPDLEAVGVPITVAAEFTDASAPQNSYTATTVDWGDGTTASASVTEPGDPLSTGLVTATKTYDRPGLYTVVVELVDERGNTVTSSSTPVRINDPAAAPRLTSIPGPITVRLGEPVAIDLSYRDDSLPDDSFTATVDWDDGNGIGALGAPEFTQATVEADGTVNVVNTYTAPGEFEVVIEIADFDEQPLVVMVPVVVEPQTTAPRIDELVLPTTPQLISDGVTVTAEFDLGTADPGHARRDRGMGRRELDHRGDRAAGR